jgi:hypothetical protein
MIWLWLLLVVARIAFYFEINLVTGNYLAFLPDVALFLALMGILLHFTVRYVKHSTRISKRDTVLLIIPAVILWVTPLPVILGAHSRLLRKQGEFRRQIAEIESVDRGRVDLLPHVDPGPPRRVAFGCGLLGGYRAALIHDPSRTADQPDATGWFRGTLRSARPIRGDWFLGTFKNAPPKKRTRAPRQIYPKGVS